MNYPFPADTINAHRFHGLIQGTFINNEGKLQLQTSFALVRLYPYFGKRGKHILLSGFKHLNSHPNDAINVYGYPHTNDDGKVARMTFVSWHVEGNTPPENQDQQQISRRFEPGQIFLCGRILKGRSKELLTVKVKSVIPGVGLRYWLITGRCIGQQPLIGSKTLFLGWIAPDGTLMLQVEKMVTPPGEKTRRPAFPKKPAIAPSIPQDAAVRDHDQPSLHPSNHALSASEQRYQPHQPVIRRMPRQEAIQKPIRRSDSLQRPQR